MKIPEVIAEAALTLLRPYAERELSLEDIDAFLSHGPDHNEYEKLLSTKEAAEALRISMATLNRMLRDGQIAKRTIRRRVFICQSEIKRIINSGHADR